MKDFYALYIIGGLAILVLDIYWRRRTNEHAGEIVFFVLYIFPFLTIPIGLIFWPVMLLVDHLVAGKTKFERIRNKRPSRTESESSSPELLLNHIGTAVSDLIPGGKVKVENKMVSAISLNGYVSAGANVELCGFDSGSYKVRKID